MSEQQKNVDRRKFIGTAAAGAGILATGGVIGWIANRGPRAAEKRPPLDQRFSYDVAEFLKIDPKLILFAETKKIPTGLEAPRCLAMDAQDNLYIGGDQMVKVLDKTGAVTGSIKLPGQPQAVARGGDGKVYVALKNFFVAYDADGKEAAKSDRLGDRVVLTAIAQQGDWVYLADAGTREVLICDAAGAVQKRFGKIGVAPTGQGFAVPSPYFDLLFSEGKLHVVNPGRHLIQRYSADGNFESVWGATGLTLEGFCGCCNPVHLARLPDGRFVTSEKGLNRIKVYSATGTFECVVAGPEQLGRDLDQTQKALTDAHAGVVYDIACDSAGRVYALDPLAKVVRVFAPKAQGAA